MATRVLASSIGERGNNSNQSSINWEPLHTLFFVLPACIAVEPRPIGFACVILAILLAHIVLVATSCVRTAIIVTKSVNNCPHYLQNFDYFYFLLPLLQLIGSFPDIDFKCGIYRLCELHLPPLSTCLTIGKKPVNNYQYMYKPYKFCSTLQYPTQSFPPHRWLEVQCQITRSLERGMSATGLVRAASEFPLA